MDYEDEITGLTSLTRPAHKMLIAEKPGGNSPASASNYRVNVNSNKIEEWVNLNLNEINWGAVHELGHQHQQNWTWTGVGESTNNVFAMFANNGLGFDSYLDTNGSWSDKAQEHWDAREAYFNLAISDRDILVFDTPGVVREPRRRNLIMFYQLWVSFGDDFYKDVQNLG